jgi:hypothetical protein
MITVATKKCQTVPYPDLRQIATVNTSLVNYICATKNKGDNYENLTHRSRNIV